MKPSSQHHPEVRIAAGRSRPAHRRQASLEQAKLAAEGGEQSHTQGPIDSILDDVCREIHTRFSEDVHIVVDVPGSPLYADNAATARAVIDRLLLGLITACQDLQAGGLELHIRTTGTSTCVVVSIEARPDDCVEEYRARVLALLVEQRDDPQLDDKLEYASVAIRDAQGSLRCREGDDGRLWVQVSLPRYTTSA
jgi:hypothetical protein